MTPDTKDPGENSARNENAVKLLRVLFHDVFCVRDAVQDVQKQDVLPVYFFGWLDQHWTELDEQELSTKAGTGPETWHFVRERLDSGVAPETFAQVWYGIILHGRPKAPCAIRTVNLICQVTFDDGSISSSQAFVPKEMVTGDIDTDDVFFMLVHTLMRQIRTAMVGAGLAGLHEEAKKNVFTSAHENDPFEVLMGWVLKHMIGGVPPPGKLHPQLKQAVENYLRLFQQYVRPPVPPHLITAYKARTEKAAAAAEGRPRGGWNA